MDDTVCNSENAENENDLVDNQDFLHNKAIPFDVKMNDTLHVQKVPKEMMKKFHKSMQYCIYQFVMKHGHYAPNQSNHITMFALDAQGIKVVPKSFPKSFSCQTCLYKTKRWSKSIQRACHNFTSRCTTAS